jgi:hypothetical protein
MFKKYSINIMQKDNKEHIFPVGTYSTKASIRFMDDMNGTFSQNDFISFNEHGSNLMRHQVQNHLKFYLQQNDLLMEINPINYARIMPVTCSIAISIYALIRNSSQCPSEYNANLYPYQFHGFSLGWPKGYPHV